MAGYTNLVFEGGGVKGVAYTGAISALDCYGILLGIENVAGTSAGAITATLLSLNYTSNEISEYVHEIHFKQFQDKWDPLRIVTKYGLYAGDKFLNWIKHYIEKKTNNADVTFGELNPDPRVPNKPYKNLHVFATDLNTNNIQHFSAEKTPDIIVAEAVRASMSIPLFFKAWKFYNTNDLCIKDHIFVDGGVLYNYPIDCFDLRDPITQLKQYNSDTLGFYFNDLPNPCGPANSLDFDEPLYYSKNLFETLLNAQIVDFNQDPYNVSRSVQINDLGIMATDFDITEKQMEELHCNGYHSTMCFLEINYSRITKPARLKCFEAPCACFPNPLIVPRP